MNLLFYFITVFGLRARMRLCYCLAILGTFALSTSALAEPTVPVKIDPYALIDVKVRPIDEATLVELGSIADRGEILKRLVQMYPNLRVLVCPSTSRDLKDPAIVWRDSRVSSSDIAFYNSRNSNPYSNVGGKFIAAESSIYEDDGTHRPLRQNDLLIVTENSSREVVLHELIHFFIHRSYIAKGINIEADLQGLSSEIDRVSKEWSESDPVSKQLNVAARLVKLDSKPLFINHGEEYAVVLLLYSLREELNLDQMELSRQLEYAQRNITELGLELSTREFRLHRFEQQYRSEIDFSSEAYQAYLVLRQSLSAGLKSMEPQLNFIQIEKLRLQKQDSSSSSCSHFLGSK